MFRRSCCAWAITLIATLALACPAQAAFQLYVQEYNSAGTAVGSSFVVNGSEDAGDLGYILGASGATPSFRFSFSATENSRVGGQPVLHLDSFNIGRTVSNTNYLIVAVSEGGSGAGWPGSTDGPLITNLSSIDGIGGATVSLTGFADAGNNLYGVPSGFTVSPPGTAFSPPLVTSSGAVATPTITMDSTNNESGITTSIPFTASGAYSLTQVVSITGLDLNQTISFNAVTTVTPAPAGLLLAITGLPGIGVLGWLRRRKAKVQPL